eukprot:SM000040S14748  [mRNA]  locus=s40:153670:154540:+ [translate_table: standard]
MELGMLHILAGGASPASSVAASARLPLRWSRLAAEDGWRRRCKLRQLALAPARATLSGAAGAAEGQPPPSRGAGSGIGGRGPGPTRLGRLVGTAARRLQARWAESRQLLPLQVLALLAGFFCANALATVLGQTGDWDVLVSGFLVAAIEGLGRLAYGRRAGAAGARTSRPTPWRRFLGLLNLWKAGLVYGLFVDAFKLGS